MSELQKVAQSGWKDVNTGNGVEAPSAKLASYCKPAPALQRKRHFCNNKNKYQDLAGRQCLLSPPGLLQGADYMHMILICIEEGKRGS